MGFEGVSQSHDHNQIPPFAELSCERSTLVRAGLSLMMFCFERINESTGRW